VLTLDLLGLIGTMGSSKVFVTWREIVAVTVAAVRTEPDASSIVEPLTVAMV
jgi:hypothetical protein